MAFPWPTEAAFIESTNIVGTYYEQDTHFDGCCPAGIPAMEPAGKEWRVVENQLTLPK